MRKIFTLLAATMCSITFFAQDIQLETKDGQVIENGSVVTIKGEMVDIAPGFLGQFDSHLYVRNLTDSNQGVYAQMKAIKEYPQICGFANLCYPTTADEPMVTTGMGLVTANSTHDMQIHTQYSSILYPNYMTDVFTCTIEITVWTDKKPEEKVSATVTFTNDPALSIENTEVVAPVIYAKDNVLYCNFADAANRQLQVFDVAGKLWKNVRLNSESETLPLEGRAKGLYIYRVMEAGKPAISGKFLVK